ncbi:MAG: hypothetical protein J0I53_07645 [Chryseobacterium sp.]|nr:hypothetical protein [Chryseobacterium sp.]
MEIKMHLPYEDIFRFLIGRGYEVMPWLWKYEDETFPGGTTQHESWTFTACKDGEKQSEKTLYLKVFEKEIKDFLKEF